MVWLSGGEKIRRYLIRFRATHERDGQTDGQTPHHGIYRAYAYASRGKNEVKMAERNAVQDMDIVATEC